MNVRYSTTRILATFADRPDLALDFYDDIESDGATAEDELNQLAAAAAAPPADKRSNFGGNFLARASKRSSVGENFMARASKRSFGDNFMARASKRGDLGSHFMARASKRDLGGNFLARASKRSKRNAADSDNKRDFGSHFMARASKRGDVNMDEILERVRNALPTRHRSFLDGGRVRGKRVYFYSDGDAGVNNRDSDQWTRPRRVIVDNLFARTTRSGLAPKVFHDEDDGQMELMEALNGGNPWKHY